MSDKPKQYGFFSQKAVTAGTASSKIYSTPDRKEVEVTMICLDREGASYNWDDKVCRGEVCNFIRRGVTHNKGYFLEQTK